MQVVHHDNRGRVRGQGPPRTVKRVIEFALRPFSICLRAVRCRFQCQQHVDGMDHLFFDIRR